jgi:hypothetical protein
MTRRMDDASLLFHAAGRVSGTIAPDGFPARSKRCMRSSGRSAPSAEAIPRPVICMARSPSSSSTAWRGGGGGVPARRMRFPRRRAHRQGRQNALTAFGGCAEARDCTQRGARAMQMAPRCRGATCMIAHEARDQISGPVTPGPGGTSATLRPGPGGTSATLRPGPGGRSATLRLGPGG